MTGIPQTQEEIRAAVEARAAEIEGTADDTLIRLHIPEGQLKVSGRELQIACMSEDSLIVRGFLSGLEYCN